MPTEHTTRKATVALAQAVALATAHSQALSHYAAGADEDDRFWATAAQTLAPAGIDVERVWRRLQAVLDNRHVPGDDPRHCERCHTLLTERRELAVAA